MSKAAQKVGPHFNPKVGPFFDKILDKCQLKNDAALCWVLEVHPPVISKTRNGMLPFGATMILRLHRKLGIPVSEIDSALAQ